MKFLRIFFFTVIILNSCSKPSAPKADVLPEVSSRADYDTTAVDSFSVGATLNVLKPVSDSLVIAKKDSAKPAKKPEVSAKKDAKDKPKKQKATAEKSPEKDQKKEAEKPEKP